MELSQAAFPGVRYPNDRLVHLTYGSNGTRSFEQDRAVNAFNEITGVTEGQGQTAWVTPAYDRAGNMTTLPLPSDPTVALSAVYDAWNRLVEVRQGEDTVAAYEYDGLGRRTVAARDTSDPGDPDGTLDTYEHFLYAGAQVLETRDAASAGAQAENLEPHTQYVWSARYVDAAVLRDENTDADGTCDDGRIYYLSDANHNVTALVDAAGAVQERYVYDPYGKVTIYDADWSDTRTASAQENTRLYTGRELDEATGLYYYRARWYDTGTGQFTSRDPECAQWGQTLNISTARLLLLGRSGCLVHIGGNGGHGRKG